jgi:hypothetical protein
MTKQRPDDTVNECVRPVEIEVTPAMIEAGVAAFCGYDPDWCGDIKETVSRIFVVMTLASSKNPT